MRIHPRKTMSCGTCVATITLLLAHPVATTAALASQTVGARPDVALTLPMRRAPDPPPGPPPSLPPAAERLAPLTLHTTVLRRSAAGREEKTEQTISRTVDRVHVSADGREWLFERNVRDARRVSGFLIDHARRTIIRYEDSDLRMSLGLRGWADVALLGFDASSLDGYTRSGRFRTIGEMRFAQYSANRQDQTGQLWWSDEQLLPATFDVAGPNGSTHFSIQAIRAGIEAELLQPPQLRFPSYRAIDLAEWREHR
jgi:hypothetical protein